MTRGMGLNGKLNTFSKKRLVAAVSRLAVNGKSMVCPVESTARVQILVLPFNSYIGLVDTVAPIGAREMQLATLAQFRRVDLHPTPNTTGIHLQAPSANS